MGNGYEQIGQRMQKAIASGDYDHTMDEVSVTGDRTSTPAAVGGGAGPPVIQGANGRELPAFVGTGPGAAVADGVNKWATGDLSFLEGKMGQR